MHLYIHNLTRHLRPTLHELKRDTHEMSEYDLDAEVNAKGEKRWEKGWVVNVSGRRRYELFSKGSEFWFRRGRWDHQKFLSFYHTPPYQSGEKSPHAGGHEIDHMFGVSTFDKALEKIALYEGEGVFWDRVENLMELLSVPADAYQAQDGHPAAPQLTYETKFSMALNLAIAETTALPASQLD